MIENRALGYRVTFVLQDFEVSSWTYSIRFKGQPRFEELIPHRRKEYQHSVLEFEQSLTLHTSGYLYERYHVTTFGYWIWERVQILSNTSSTHSSAVTALQTTRPDSVSVI